VQGAIGAAIEYIEASAKAGTPAEMMITIQKDRVDNLKSMPGRMPPDLQDTTDAISTLGSTLAFTP